MLTRLAMTMRERDPEAGTEEGEHGGIVFDSSCPVSIPLNFRPYKYFRISVNC